MVGLDFLKCLWPVLRPLNEIQALPEAVSAGWYKNGRTTIGKERGAGVCSHGAWDMRRYVQPLPLGAALTPPASACVRRTGAGAVGLGGIPRQLGHQLEAAAGHLQLRDKQP